MLQRMPIHDAVVGLMTRGRGPVDLLDPRCIFHVEHIRDGVTIDEFDAPNAVTNAAKNDWLNAYFNRTSTQTFWCIGLIDNPTFSTTSAADTPGSHSGWNEFTAYSQGAGNTTLRPSWGQGTPSGQQITNASSVVYTFTSNGGVWGIFVQSDPAKSGTGGILWSTAAFNAALNVLSGDQLKVNYTIQL